MSHNLLSKTGLTYFWGKLKNAFISQSADVTYLGEDDGTATVADFSPATDTVWNKAQTLSSSQQLQARTNIGIPTFVHLTDESEMPVTPDSNTVYFIDEAQSS